MGKIDVKASNASGDIRRYPVKSMSEALRVKTLLEDRLKAHGYEVTIERIRGEPQTPTVYGSNDDRG